MTICPYVDNRETYTMDVFEWLDRIIVKHISRRFASLDVIQREIETIETFLRPLDELT